jgi:Rrf2 family protein
MLRISKKGDYAMFLMGYLAQHGDGEHVVSAQEIADRSGLHKSVVANLLKELTKGALLTSVRGIHGGYRLAKPAEQISLGEILNVVEGPFALVDCARSEGDHVGPGDAHCSLLSFCPSKTPMRVLHARIAALMSDLKLSDLVEAPVGAGAAGENPVRFPTRLSERHPR